MKGESVLRPSLYKYLNCSQSLQHSLSWICVASMLLNWNVLSTCCLMNVAEEEKLSNRRKIHRETSGNGILCKFYGGTYAQTLYFTLQPREKNIPTTKKVLNKLKKIFYSSIRRLLIFTSRGCRHSCLFKFKPFHKLECGKRGKTELKSHFIYRLCL